MDAREAYYGPTPFNSWWFSFFFIFFIIIGNSVILYLLVSIDNKYIGSSVLANMVVGVIALNYSIYHEKMHD